MSTRSTDKRKKLPLLLLVILPTIAIGAWLVAERMHTRSVVANDPNPIAWQTNLSVAIDRAASEDKNVLVRFSADWCPPCNLMDLKVWPNEAVKSELTQNFVPVEIDVDLPESESLLQRFGVRGIPTLIVLNSAGVEIKRANYLDRTQTIQFLQESNS